MSDHRPSTSRSSHYLVEFNSPDFDTRILRDFLIRKLGASSFRITESADSWFRTPPQVLSGGPGTGQNVSSLSGLKHNIFLLLGNGKAWRMKEIDKHLGGRRSASAIRGLITAGFIRKLQHGIYARYDFPNPEPAGPLHSKAAGPKNEKVLDLLSKPRSGVELRQLLGVTRQAVDQKVKRMMRDGLVDRIDLPSEGGQYLYVRKGASMSAAILSRTPPLKAGAIQLLSTLPLEGVVKFATICETAGLDHRIARRHLATLTNAGYALTVNFGQTIFVSLTPAGLTAPDYNALAVKAPVSNFVKDIGCERLNVLQILYVLGEAKSIEITFVTGYNRGPARTSFGTGNLIARLRELGLVETTMQVKKELQKPHPNYRLTRAGQALVAVINKQHPYPKIAGDLRVIIHQEYESHLAKLKELQRPKNSRGIPYTDCLGLRQREIIGIVRQKGPVTAFQIHAQMVDKYRNKRSINLALQNLAQNGHIVESQEYKKRRKPKNAKFWAVVP